MKERNRLLFLAIWRSVAIAYLVGVVIFGGLAWNAEAAESYSLSRATVLETEEPYTISWCNAEGQTSSAWEVTVQVMKFPPEDGALPVAGTSQPASDPSSWVWVPENAGAYYVRARSCEGDNCSPWGVSIAQEEETPGCTQTPEAFIYYVELKALTGGGIE